MTLKERLRRVEERLGVGIKKVPTIKERVGAARQAVREAQAPPVMLSSKVGMRCSRYTLRGAH